MTRTLAAYTTVLCAVAAVSLVAAPARAAAPGWMAGAVSEYGALAPTGLEFAADASGVLTWEAYEPDHRPNPKLTGLARRTPLGTWTRGPDVPDVTWGLPRVHVLASRTVVVGMRAYRFGAYNRAR